MSLATFQTASVAGGSVEKSSGKKSKRTDRSVQFDDESSIVSRGGESMASGDVDGASVVGGGRADSPPPAAPRGMMGLLAWLRRRQQHTT